MDSFSHCDRNGEMDASLYTSFEATKSQNGRESYIFIKPWLMWTTFLYLLRTSWVPMQNYTSRLSGKFSFYKLYTHPAKYLRCEMEPDTSSVLEIDKGIPLSCIYHSDCEFGNCQWVPELWSEEISTSIRYAIPNGYQTNVTAYQSTQQS